MNGTSDLRVEKIKCSSHVNKNIEKLIVALELIVSLRRREEKSNHDVYIVSAGPHINALFYQLQNPEIILATSSDLSIIPCLPTNPVSRFCINSYTWSSRRTALFYWPAMGFYITSHCSSYSDCPYLPTGHQFTTSCAKANRLNAPHECMATSI